MRADDDLLAAYCDGVAELTVEERKRVEALLAGDASLRADEAATRSTLAQLRDLPAEGAEPDWLAMERAIRAQVGPDVPRSWLRPIWRWLVPITALATAATIAVVVLDAPSSSRGGELAVVHDAGVTTPAPIERAAEVAMWLDGQEVVLEELDDELFDDVDEVLLDGEPTHGVDGLLPAGDLAWIDELDEADTDFAEQWLEERTPS